MYFINNKEYKCSVAVTLDIFNDRWKLAVIWHLLDNSKRFKDLHEDIAEITQKTLTVKLKELEEKNIINREVFPEVPPKVVYSLTPIGEQLKPVLKEMYKWGIKYVEDYGELTNDNLCDAEFKISK
ncbi:transcriptional regulator [Malaciobacter canalis]|jgi:DNA-binding HxlR family transcriptional regulator|uniref:Transcriptional regulator n=1 Tax=Malaciobacter canalis TaxID=1912871 RepID=A0ABX4LN74_9BACT|nr:MULTISPECIES: helix-turn-helix domain-containing protein [Malaciobacter]PHO08995.1 transcriptional regulator [Malaciobacter canalis]QEE32770.1 transcriptional regulator, HxlR family [Malaciobacter canalis]SKB57715.1 transcriptional regulator, HxlR family [Malaciobacter marinus]